LDAELARFIRNRHNKDTKPSDIRNRWGYYASVEISGRGTRGTSWDAWCRQFTNGIRNALTIEELAELGVYPYFFRISLNDQTNDGTPERVYLKTEPQYFAELKKWRAWRNGNERNFYLSFYPHDTDEVLKRLRAPRRKARREKIPA